jgi:hypothetical protein
LITLIDFLDGPVNSTAACGQDNSVGLMQAPDGGALTCQGPSADTATHNPPDTFVADD